MLLVVSAFNSLYAHHYNLTEVITQVPITIQSSEWTTVHSASHFVALIVPYQPHGNAIARFYGQFDMTTSSPSSRFEWGFWINGVQAGWYDRRLPPRASPALHGSLHIWAPVDKSLLFANQYNSIEIKCRSLDGGSAKFVNRFLSFSHYPGYTASAYSHGGCSGSVQDSWVTINQVNFSVAQTSTIGGFSYVKYDWGTQLRREIDFEFLLDGVTVSSFRMATGYAAPDGQHLAELIPNVAPGTHVLTLRARAPGSSVNLNCREIYVQGFPVFETNYWSSYSDSAITIQPDGQWVVIADSGPYNHPGTVKQTFIQGYFEILQVSANTQIETMYTMDPIGKDCVHPGHPFGECEIGYFTHNWEKVDSDPGQFFGGIQTMSDGGTGEESDTSTQYRLKIRARVVLGNSPVTFGKRYFGQVATPFIGFGH